MNLQPQRTMIGARLTDNDFFHLTFHIDANLNTKIENGHYVDLDKFLPREKSFDGNQNFSNETKLEWVQSEDSMYLVSARKTSRIKYLR